MQINNNLLHKLKLNSKSKVAIIGSSFCSCLMADFIKSKYKSKIIFYEKTKFIGGAWRFDEHGNIFSNILAPTSIRERKTFKKIIRFLDKKKITIRKTNFKSFYSNKIVDSYFFDFNNFYKKIKKRHIIRNLKVNSICEDKNYILINKKFKHDYVFFPNYVKINKIYKTTFPLKTFVLPKGKQIKSKHIRILCKTIIKDKLKYLFYNEKKFGPVDRLQIIQLKNKIFKISGIISLESKKKTKKFLIDELSKLLNLKNIIEVYIETYDSINYTIQELQKIHLINQRFSRVKHYHTTSVVGFIKKYFL